MKIEKLLKEIEELIIVQEYYSAEKYLLQVMDKYPEHPEVHYLLGDVYCKLERFELAIEHEKIANNILPGNSQILNLLGWAYFMNGDIPTGRKYMQMALEINPDEIRVLCDLSVLETRAGDKKALYYAQKALLLAPNDPMVQKVVSAAQLFITAREKIKEKNKKAYN
jgi:tetratricopeptide (TPR) repeat protein